MDAEVEGHNKVPLNIKKLVVDIGGVEMWISNLNCWFENKKYV
jgi:hypothetical protein